MQSGTTLSPFNASYHDKAKNENNDGGLVQCNRNNTGDHPKKNVYDNTNEHSYLFGCFINWKIVKIHLTFFHNKLFVSTIIVA